MSVFIMSTIKPYYSIFQLPIQNRQKRKTKLRLLFGLLLISLHDVESIIFLSLISIRNCLMLGVIKRNPPFKVGSFDNF